MADPVVSIPALLKKTEHYDKDERYMATSDLCEVLKRYSDASSAAAAAAASSAAAGGTAQTGAGTAAATVGRQQQQQRVTGSGGGGRSGMDVTTERQICTAVLRLLHDKSNDVQAIAVKTLGVLLTTVQEEQVLEIADSLTDQVLDASKSELRDVYAIGLRTLVKTIPNSMGHAVSSRLVGRLLEGIRTSSASAANAAAPDSFSPASPAASSSSSSNQNEEIVLACLDILTDVLGRFGATAVSVVRQHEQILHICLHQLSYGQQPVIRKRAGNTIGCLSVVLSDALLTRMVESLLQQIDKAQGIGKVGKRKTQMVHAAKAKRTTTSPEPASAAGIGDTRALIRTMCTVSGAVGHRLGQEQIDRILPIFLRFTDPEDAVTGDDDDHDDGDDDDDDNNNNYSKDQEDMMHDGTGTGAAEENDDEEAAVALANELRESCFMGFESFVLRCPKEVEPHLEKIIQAALAYMSYDPNYSYGDDEEDDNNNQDEMDQDDDQGEDEEEMEEEDDYGDDEDDEEEDDDDDESWKVRRSAIRALKAVVEAKKADPTSLWISSTTVRRGKSTLLASALVGRFKEREENCRVGVIDCFTRLLAVTIASTEAGITAFDVVPNNNNGGAMEVDDNSNNKNNTAKIDLRGKYAPRLVKACEKILSVRKGNERSKSSALSLLATLSRAPGGVGGQSEIATVFKHIKTFLSTQTSSSAAGSGGGADYGQGTSKALRLDALSLVHSMLASNRHDPQHIRDGLKTELLPELCQAVQEQWYKVIAEALRALAEVPRFFVQESSNDETKQVATLLYTAIQPLLAAHDVDQEIKECALRAAASLLASLQRSLTTDQTTQLLTLLLERLKNETTQIAAIKTLAAIAASPKNTTLEPILADSITTLASFLRSKSRSLKQSSLEALDIVIINHGDGNKDAFASGELYSNVLQELAPLIVDTDLHLSHLSLRVSVSILKACPAVGSSVKANVLERALVLSTSSLLQDVALESLLALFKQIVVSEAVAFAELLAQLRGRLNQNGGCSKHGVYNLAKCIAAITASTTKSNAEQVVKETFQLLDGKTPADNGVLRQVQLSLLVSGDLGRLMDLSELGGDVADRLKNLYLMYFDSTSEDLKHASAYALGNAAIGSQSAFLQAIVERLNNDEKEEYRKQQYLLLSALREFIQSTYLRQYGGPSTAASTNKETIVASLPLIVPPLEKLSAEEEEGVRTMVAECMGSLTCLQVDVMLQKLKVLYEQNSVIQAPDGVIADEDKKSKRNSLICWTVATSIKLAIAGKVDPNQLATYLPSFLPLLQQQELNVRNAALLMVYSAVHHMPQVVSGSLTDSILPSLFEVAKLKHERKVDLGPFTHTVDDALPLRKAALSIFATCLENLPGSLDIAAFMPVLAKSLGDAEDIQLHAHQIIISMCQSQPSYLIQSVETFVEPLEKTINKKAGTKTGTELERLNDWIKSALRVILQLATLDGAMTNSRKFADFVARVKDNSKFTNMIAAIEEEER